MEKTKVCTMCGKELTIDNYYKNGKYFRSRCKKCSNEISSNRTKKRYIEDEEFREKCKRKSLDRYNSMTTEEKKRMLDMQRKQRSYRINNRRSKHVRAARKRKYESTFTSSQWEKAKSYFDNKCAYCGKESILEQDHFIPLSSGGEYTHNNIVPVCKSCNSSKQAKDFFIWYPNHESYDKKRKDKILKFLNYSKDKSQQLSIIY